MYTFLEDSAGISDVPGFKASGVGCDIRRKNNERLDVALVYSELPCVAAGTFTTNDVKAAPVRLDMAHLAAGGPFHAIIANSGNANACTGAEGADDALEMARLTAGGLGVPTGSVFVCSTGRIGERLPMDRVRSGIAKALAALGDTPEHGNKAAWAILTSDTKPKTATARFEFAGKTIVIAGFAKGAGMIQPNMATMLAFIGTNLALETAEAAELLRGCVFASFNRVSVDGDTSTNDTCLLLANGASGLALSSGGAELRALFNKALQDVCSALARKIVGDGERITKVVRLTLKGAPDDASAEKATRAIANSLLVKTSWFGGDPNWGRVLHAAGYARIGLDESLVDMHYGDVPVILDGQPLHENKPRWKEVVAQRHFSISLDLKLGPGSFEMLANDLSEGYVNFNKSE